MSDFWPLVEPRQLKRILEPRVRVWSAAVRSDRRKGLWQGLASEAEAEAEDGVGLKTEGFERLLREALGARDRRSAGAIDAEPFR